MGINSFFNKLLTKNKQSESAASHEMNQVAGEEVQRLREEQEQLQTRIAEKERVEQQKNNQIIKLKAQLIKLQNEQYVKQNQLEQKEHAWQAQRNIATKFDETVAQIQKELTQAQANKRQLQASHDALSEQLAKKENQLREQLASAYSAKKAQETIQVSYKQQLARANTSINQLQQKKDELTKKLKEKEQQLTKVPALGKELESTQKKLALLQVSHDALARQLDKKEQLLKKRDTVEAEHKKTIKEYEEKVAELQRQVNAEKGNVIHEKMMLRKTLQANKQRIEELEQLLKIHKPVQTFEEVTYNIIEDQVVEQVATTEETAISEQPLVLETETAPQPSQVQEKPLEKEQVEQLIKAVIDNSFESEKQAKRKKPKKQRNARFARRGDSSYENQHMTQAVQIAQQEYSDIAPTAGRFAIRDRSEWQSDYATNYVNGIRESRKEERRSKLRYFIKQPYFARLDAVTDDEGAETWYITDANVSIRNDIVSWKSDAASLFYLKTVGVPIQHKTLGTVEVDYIQEFGVSNGQITTMYPPLTSTSNQQMEEGYLVDTLKKNKGQSMESIVSTIQKEQYEMISLPIDKSIIIQGSAGSGKSAIALHRLSYLLYQYKTLTSDKVAIIGPNETFLQYIKLVLPALGDFNVQQLTLITLAQSRLGILGNITSEQRKEVAKVKGSLAFSALIEKVTTDAMNQLSNWTETLKIENITVTSMPVLQQMDNYKHITNKDRANLYYNLFLKQYTAQMNKENQFIQAKQQQLDTVAKQFVKQHAKLPSLTVTTFINESITAKIMKLKENLATYPDSKNAVNQYVYKQIKDEVFMYIQETIAKFETLPASWLQDIVTQEWAFYVENALLKEQDQYFKERVKAEGTYTTYTALMKNTNFEENWARKKQNIEKRLEQEKESFMSTVYAKLTDFVMNNICYYVENELIQAVHSAFKGIVPTYNLNISPKFVYDKLPLLANTDVTYKKIQQFVTNKLELNAVKLFTQLMAQNPEFSFNAKNITKQDMAPLLHIHRLLNGVDETKRFNYMIIDEAQDYMPYEIQEMRMLTTQNGIMLIGDLGQNINEISTLENWSDYDDLLNQPHRFELTATYRSTKSIVEFSNNIIAPFAEGRYNLSTIAYREGVPVEFVHYRSALDESEKLIMTLEKCLEKPELKQVTVILKNETQLDKYLDIIDPYFTNKVQTGTERAENCKVVLTTAENAKGLEFETVVLVDFNAYNATDQDRKLAYVASSRALHQLIVFKNEKSPCPLL